RYLEVEAHANGQSRRVLLPMPFCRVGSAGVTVQSIFAAHFADVPVTKKPDEVTLLEEEKITAYYGAGTLYADPSRAEPIL
ncbi:MAG: photosynthetic reaction center subunit H, partial [Planctomycetes bacterium]|nr:photosynthetic reaction center subunit H [Planctomycetota bacterium]